jgi:hypothetical protein
MGYETKEKTHLNVFLKSEGKDKKEMEKKFSFLEQKRKFRGSFLKNKVLQLSFYFAIRSLILKLRPML